MSDRKYRQRGYQDSGGGPKKEFEKPSAPKKENTFGPRPMNMPGTRKTVKLTSTGNGIHKGSVTIGMAGDWDVTVTASRNGQQLDAKRMKLTAK